MQKHTTRFAANGAIEHRRVWRKSDGSFYAYRGFTTRDHDELLAQAVEALEGGDVERYERLVAESPSANGDFMIPMKSSLAAIAFLGGDREAWQLVAELDSTLPSWLEGHSQLSTFDDDDPWLPQKSSSRSDQ